MTIKTTKFTILDRGDIRAPKGTPSWCVGVREQARSALHDAKTTRERTRNWLKALREDNHFQRLTDKKGRTFLSWEAFCAEPPPFGFGCSAEEVEALVAAKPLGQRLAADEEVAALTDHGGAREGAGRKPADLQPSGQNEENQVANGKLKSDGTNAASYLVRRLKRDAPKVAEALAQGKYPSARAAAIAAGIVKPPTRAEVIQREFRLASAKEKDAIMAWFQTVATEGW